MKRRRFFADSFDPGLFQMKTKRMIQCLAVFALAFFAGCVATEEMNKTMSTWEGHSVKELLASWGTPTSTASDGQGGQILTYNKSHTEYLPASYTPDYAGAAVATYSWPEGDPALHARTHTPAQTPTIYTPPQSSRVNRMRVFWVDSSGRIYRWSWKGV